MQLGDHDTRARPILLQNRARDLPKAQWLHLCHCKTPHGRGHQIRIRTIISQIIKNREDAKATVRQLEVRRAIEPLQLGHKMGRGGGRVRNEIGPGCRNSRGREDFSEQPDQRPVVTSIVLPSSSVT